MEAAASVAVAARGVSMTMPSSQSQSSRKEWRVVSDHPVQNSGNDGRESVNADFFPITVDGGSEHELRLEDVVKQREQLQHLEVNLKARLIARSEVIGMQERFETQMKDHITANVKLQEQLHEREKAIMELQRTLEDKDKELHAIRLDHEAAWAKEDLLREQNKELASFRRERDNSEAERAQHLQNIHDLQEHVQEKDRQFLELQEQHRVAQETIIYKDEQIREAQAWIARVQEMDALQSNTHHSLQAELRERTEQYNQLWVGCQRQFAEMERLHVNTLKQLEIELSEARERGGTTQTNVKDTSSHFVHNNGTQDSRGLQNGEAENISSNTENTPAVQVAPQSLHNMPPYFPPGQMAALHPFILHHHHQGLPQNLNSHIVQSHVGQFHSLSSPLWQNQQAISESLQIPNHELRPESNYEYEANVNGKPLRSDFLDVHLSQGVESHSVVQSSSNEEEQSLNDQSQQNAQQIASQFHASLILNDSDNHNVHQEKTPNFLTNHAEAQKQTTETEVIQVKVSEAPPSKVASAPLVPPTGPKKPLFDEETLLACVVRTIPPGPGGRIQISSTLLSRLTKMLAPLHWSDYENKHGQLVVFLGSHPELFVIEGDYIQVREGAQEIIAAMVAQAKVRAAAASATSSHPSLMSSVAVTPMARTRGGKKAPAGNSSYLNGQASGNMTNGNGANVGPQSKGIIRGTPSYHGKQQGRSSAGLLGSRK